MALSLYRCRRRFPGPSCRSDSNAINRSRINPHNCALGANFSRKSPTKEVPVTNLPPFRLFSPRIARIITAAAAVSIGLSLHAQSKTDAKADSDELVLSNGDTLHGKFVNEIGGKITFHTDAFGDLTVGWDKIKALHTSQKVAVLSDQEKAPSKKAAQHLPTGTLSVEN